MARIVVPRNALKFMMLFVRILQKHISEGEQSPLNNVVDMKHYNSINENAQVNNDKAKEANRIKENYIELRDNDLVDINKAIRQIRDLLLALNPNNPHALGEWGFEVRAPYRRKNNKDEEEKNEE